MWPLRYVAARRGRPALNYLRPEQLKLEISMFGKTAIALS
jgi:hypothetical protein